MEMFFWKACVLYIKDNFSHDKYKNLLCVILYLHALSSKRSLLSTTKPVKPSELLDGKYNLHA